MMSNGRMFAFLLLLVALANYGGVFVEAQGEPQVVEVFQETDAIPLAEEVKSKFQFDQSSPVNLNV